MEAFLEMDSAASATAPESTCDRLDKHRPSPAESFRKCRQQIFEIAAKMPRRQNVASRILDENEDGAFHMGLDKRSKTELAKKMEREGALMDMLTEGKSAADERAGVQKMDWEVSAAANPAFARYWEWQVERKASGGSADTSSILSKVVRSKMGRFGLIPGELRNKMYRFVLVKESEIFAVTGLFEVQGEFAVIGAPSECNLGPCTHTRLSREVPDILSTCKQIRHEALPILLAENKIHFDWKTVRYRCTANFLRTLGPYARFIRHVTLDIMVWVTVDPFQPTRRLRHLEPFSIHVTCPASNDGKFEVHIDSVIYNRVQVDANRLIEFKDSLNERVNTENMEQLLLEFVWSDRLAELVWKCDQGRY